MNNEGRAVLLISKPKMAQGRYSVLTVAEQMTGKWGPIAAEVVTWLPGLVVTEIMGQSLIFIYCLAIAHLYTQSLRANDV